MCDMPQPAGFCVGLLFLQQDEALVAGFNASLTGWVRPWVTGACWPARFPVRVAVCVGSARACRLVHQLSRMSMGTERKQRGSAAAPGILAGRRVQGRR